MKVKDLERTANIAWAPSTHTPICLAAGTAAQQLDASFNTNALLEIYALNLSEPGVDMELKAAVPTEHRFHKIVWGGYGQSNGTIVGGCDGGLIQIFNASKIIKQEDGFVSQQKKHIGPVHSLDFNQFQSNLLATGASESEIYIWDLNNTSTPMTPGMKSQPFEDVLSIAWNKQVQHILASTFTSKCVVWDLRKNEPIIKLMDTVSRIRWKVVAWHPEVATQLCLASEEDHAPVIQLWDLRFATSPLKTLENHQRGILSMAWCNQDPDLLVSVGKDNRILCWNPNSNQSNGEVLSEIAKTNQWNFDVQWCPKNPALIACPSFDGHVSVYSIMGGQIPQVQTTNKIADSFPGMDGYIEAPVPQQNIAPVSVDLSKPPKWLKRPVGASFGFGGKLITFTNDKSTQTQHPDQVNAPTVRTVYVSQLVTEDELVEKSFQLEQALEYGNFIEYCQAKIDKEMDVHKKNIWRFLKANFEENPRNELLNLLGYNMQEINNELNELTRSEIDQLSNQTNNLLDFEENKTEDRKTPFLIKTDHDTEGSITRALLLGNTEAAVELCFQAKRYADAIIIAMTGGSELLAKTQIRYLQQSPGYISSLISALVSEDWSSVIEGCNINSWKEALVASLTHANQEELPKLCELLGTRLEQESQINPDLKEDAQLCYICAGNFDKLVASWSGAVTRSDELQELVELVTFLQKAIERQGRSVQVTGKLADLLSDYALILASQGNLTTALTYLGQSSQNEKVSALRERLTISLGRKPFGYNQPRSRTTSTRQSFSQNPFSGPQNVFNPPAVPFSNQNPFNPTPITSNQFNTGLPNQGIVSQPWQQQPQPNIMSQPVKTFSPPPPPASHPPRPSSQGSSQGGSNLPSRAKYIIDPSVQSGNPYGGRLPYQAAPTVPFSQPSFQPNAVYNPQQPSIGSFPQAQSTVGTLNPTGYEKPPEMGQIPQLAPVNNAAGWNDPPAFTGKPLRNFQPKPEVSSQDPITHPLYGAVPAAPDVPLPTNGFKDMYGQPSGGFPPPASTFQQLPPSIPTSTFNPQSFNQNALNPAFQQPQPTPVQPVSTRNLPEIPQPVQKGPIPDEHRIMQVVFDDLREKCSLAANNPQTKRKLEDVARKLEIFYDLLRDQKLSPSTLTNLHQLVQLVQSGDYANCLGLHTQMVSGQDFSQIASFMPGLKVLIQCALQLQVYLR